MTTTTLTARIDCTLLRGQNNREHHRARAARVVAEREATRLALSSGDWRGDVVSLRRPELGARVTIVRPFVSTALDSDNLSAACKAVRDEVAAFLGVDDASPRLHWVYLQAPAAVLGSSVKAAVVNRRGRVTRKATTRPSKDHDTRPLLRIEVLPVGDIDPQQQRIAALQAAVARCRGAMTEARNLAVTSSIAHFCPHQATQLADGLDKALAETVDNQERP
jgi:hypothetical protein